MPSLTSQRWIQSAGTALAAASLLFVSTTSCDNSRGRRGAVGAASLGGATGIITDQGGLIEITNKKSVARGTKVVGDIGAADTNETITVKIRPEKSLPASLPAGYTALSKSVSITKSTPLNFVLPVAITIPYDPAQMQPGDEPFAAYWEPAYGKYLPCGVTNIDTTAKTMTFKSAHCTSFVALSRPGAAATPASVDTGFVPGVDSLFHPNFGSYPNPGGSSVGLAAYASWYYQFKKATDTKNLYDKYRQGNLASFQDDVVAKELITRVYCASLPIWAYLWNSTACLASQASTGMQLINNMAFTGAPQLMLLRGTGTGGSKFASVVLVFKFDATAGEFSIYDPNFPSETVQLSWSAATGFSNYTKASAYPGPITEYCYDSTSSILSPVQFESYYTAAELGWLDDAGTAGEDFIRINLTAPTVDASGQALITDLLNPVVVTGVALTGTEIPRFVAYYVNGNKKKLTPVDANGNFTFTLQQTDIPNANNSLIMIATNEPRDEWRAFSGFRAITLRKQGVNFFTNLGFETCDFTGWVAETHTWQNSTPGSFTPGKSVVSPGGPGVFDPIATTLSLPFAGTCAARVNSQDNQYHISSVTQTAVVPNVPNPQLQFNWAAVLEDPQHSPSIQPYVDIVVTDDTAGTVLYARNYYANDPSYTGWIPFLGGSWKAIDWQVAFVDVSTAQGHSITIKVSAADCGAGGHGGYVYLDAEE